MRKDGLIKLAKEIGKILRNLKEVRAIAVGGSLVSGYPDKYSDLDIFCLVTKRIGVKKRKNLLEKFKINELKGQKEGMDSFYHKGVLTDIQYLRLSDVDDLIERIKLTGWISESDAPASKFIYHKVILDSKKLFYNYKKKLNKYIRIGRAYAKSYSWSELKNEISGEDRPGGGGIYVAIKRRNYIEVSMLFADMLKRYLYCLYFLNNVFYYKGLEKWSFKKIKEFKYKPKNCVKRLEKIAVLGNKGKELKQKIKLFKKLIEDTDPVMKKL